MRPSLASGCGGQARGAEGSGCSWPTGRTPSASQPAGRLHQIHARGHQGWGSPRGWPTGRGCARKQPAARGHCRTATRDTGKVSREEGRGTPGPLFSKIIGPGKRPIGQNLPQNVIINRGQTSASQKLDYQVLDLPSHLPQLRHRTTHVKQQLSGRGQRAAQNSAPWEGTQGKPKICHGDCRTRGLRPRGGKEAQAKPVISRH